MGPLLPIKTPKFYINSLVLLLFKKAWVFYQLNNDTASIQLLLNHMETKAQRL